MIYLPKYMQECGHFCPPFLPIHLKLNKNSGWGIAHQGHIAHSLALVRNRLQCIIENDRFFWWEIHGISWGPWSFIATFAGACWLCLDSPHDAEVMKNCPTFQWSIVGVCIFYPFLGIDCNKHIQGFVDSVDMEKPWKTMVPRKRWLTTVIREIVQQQKIYDTLW
jgi:hypothetical protein